ncbi:MAG TPA: GNAT family N-acetyltransferase [Aggregatilineales bacterium]|nr:GNAT family N-acetyltransferase [Aggregatilineales bacterium]
MLTLNPLQISDKLKALFNHDDPAAFRLRAALESHFPARIFTDDANAPTWAVLQETAFGTLYLAGSFTVGQLTPIIEQTLQDSDEVLFGYWDWQGNALKPLFPAPHYEGTVFDFTGRDPSLDLDAFCKLPAGFHFQSVDPTRFDRSADAEFNRRLYGVDAAQRMLGYYVLKGDQIAAEAFASPPLDGIVEVGMQTVEVYRQRGLATALCAYLIRACEARGWSTYWNCNTANLPSVKIARKLGYRTERLYTLLGWFKAT